MKNEEIIESLILHNEKINSYLQRRINDVNLYFYIKRIFNTRGNIKNNEEFKKVYKKFYVLNSAGLAPSFFDSYFELLDSRNKKLGLKEILEYLYKIPTKRGVNSLQFSFTTKLLHTINNRLPIYDKNIGFIFNLLQPNDLNVPLSKRIKKRVEIYNHLKLNSRQLIADRRVKEFLNKYRQFFGWNNTRVDKTIDDVKLLDFLLWALGDILKLNRQKFAFTY